MKSKLLEKYKEKEKYETLARSNPVAFWKKYQQDKLKQELSEKRKYEELP